MTDTDKTAAHISPGLVRLSVGYTGTVEQRWKQLSEALQRVGAVAEKQIA
jgi:methionine-gamma-lyase